jgi:hypothetical protein
MPEVIIHVRDAKGIQVTYAFEQSAITLGRGNGNDVVLALPSVSSKHARLEIRENQLVIVDLGTTNGVWVDGRRVRGEREISPSDKIHIAGFDLQIEDARGALRSESVVDPIPTPGSRKLSPKEVEEVLGGGDAVDIAAIAPESIRQFFEARLEEVEEEGEDFDQDRVIRLAMRLVRLEDLDRSVIGWHAAAPTRLRLDIVLAFLSTYWQPCYHPGPLPAGSLEALFDAHDALSPGGRRRRSSLGGMLLMTCNRPNLPEPWKTRILEELVSILNELPESDHGAREYVQRVIDATGIMQPDSEGNER